MVLQTNKYGSRAKDLDNIKVALLHYTAPPVVGGVEAVVLAHSRLLIENGFNVTVIAGKGSESSLPAGTKLMCIPEMDTQHPDIVAANQLLESGKIPSNYSLLVEKVKSRLEPTLGQFTHIIIHNVLTKHFNLPLTDALSQIMHQYPDKHWISWVHDISWTSPNSRSKVHNGYPWDLLRTYHPGQKIITVSRARQQSLADLYKCSAGDIEVVYNGVDIQQILGLSDETMVLAQRMGLFTSDIVMIMPVRITKAKNFEKAFEIIGAVKQLGFTAKLVITGPPDPHDANNMEYYRSLLALSQKLNLSSEISFVYTSGPSPDTPYLINTPQVFELLRLSDVLLMLSHREGFGMPILEAGLAGLPVVSSQIPAASEIGDKLILSVDNSTPYEELSVGIISWLQTIPTFLLRQKIKHEYTWQAIFEKQIIPLLRKQ